MITTSSPTFPDDFVKDSESYGRESLPVKDDENQLIGCVSSYVEEGTYVDLEKHVDQIENLKFMDEVTGKESQDIISVEDINRDSNSSAVITVSAQLSQTLDTQADILSVGGKKLHYVGTKEEHFVASETPLIVTPDNLLCNLSHMDSDISLVPSNTPETESTSSELPELIDFTNDLLKSISQDSLHSSDDNSPNNATTAKGFTNPTFTDYFINEEPQKDAVEDVIEPSGNNRLDLDFGNSSFMQSDSEAFSVIYSPTKADGKFKDVFQSNEGSHKPLKVGFTHLFPSLLNPSEVEISGKMEETLSNSVSEIPKALLSTDTGIHTSAAENVSRDISDDEIKHHSEDVCANRLSLVKHDSFEDADVKLSTINMESAIENVTAEVNPGIEQSEKSLLYARRSDDLVGLVFSDLGQLGTDEVLVNNEKSSTKLKQDVKFYISESVDFPCIVRKGLQEESQLFGKDKTNEESESICNLSSEAKNSGDLPVDNVGEVESSSDATDRSRRIEEEKDQEGERDVLKENNVNLAGKIVVDDNPVLEKLNRRPLVRQDSFEGLSLDTTSIDLDKILEEEKKANVTCEDLAEPPPDESCTCLESTIVSSENTQHNKGKSLLELQKDGWYFSCDEEVKEDLFTQEFLEQSADSVNIESDEKYCRAESMAEEALANADLKKVTPTEDSTEGDITPVDSLDGRSFHNDEDTENILQESCCDEISGTELSEVMVREYKELEMEVGRAEENDESGSETEKCRNDDFEIVNKPVDLKLVREESSNVEEVDSDGKETGEKENIASYLADSHVLPPEKESYAITDEKNMETSWRNTVLTEKNKVDVPIDDISKSNTIYYHGYGQNNFVTDEESTVDGIQPIPIKEINEKIHTEQSSNECPGAYGGLDLELDEMNSYIDDEILTSEALVTSLANSDVTSSRSIVLPGDEKAFKARCDETNEAELAQFECDTTVSDVSYVIGDISLETEAFDCQSELLERTAAVSNCSIVNQTSIPSTKPQTSIFNVSESMTAKTDDVEIDSTLVESKRETGLNVCRLNHIIASSSDFILTSCNFVIDIQFVFEVEVV